jgi:Leucine-rich repeat (LRR) protein
MRGWIALLVSVSLYASLLPLNAQEPRPPRKVALLIGPATYLHDFTPLPYLDADVKALAAELQAGGFDQIVVLTDPPEGKHPATKENFLTQLEQLLDGGGDKTKAIRRDDVTLLVFSGHGLEIFVDGQRKETFFAPIDGKRGDTKTLINVGEVLAKVGACGCRTLILADMCREIYDPNKGKGLDTDNLRLPRNAAVLFGCESSQQSFVNEELKHSLFTYAVLEVMRESNRRGEPLSWSKLVHEVEQRFESPRFQRLMGEGVRQTPVPRIQDLRPTVLLAPRIRAIQRTVAAAWAAAGIDVGWGRWQYAQFFFVADGAVSDDVPAFRVRSPLLLRWDELPSPEQPFALFLTGDVSKVDFGALARFSQLTALCLNSTNLTDAGLAEVAKLSGLKELYVWDTKITDAGLKGLAARLPQLEKLDISITSVTDAGLAEVAKLSGLKELYVGGTEITDAGLKGLAARLPQLEKLDIAKTGVTDAGLAEVAKLSGLKELCVGGTKITDAGLKGLAARLPQLEKLNIGRTGVTDAGLAEVVKLSGLKELYVWDTKITDAGLKGLAARLPQLEKLNIGRTGVTDAGLAEVVKLSGLKELYVWDTKITDAGLKGLAARLPQLEKLDISITSVTDAGLAEVAKLSGLKELYVGGTEITDAGLKGLAARLPQLEKLDIAKTGVTDAGLAEVVKLSGLKELYVWDTEITDAGLKRLAARLPQLETLHIGVTGVTDAGLAEVAKLKNLKELWINRTNTTEKGRAQLKAALRDCKIYE